jgi:hypothetical protein
MSKDLINFGGGSLPSVQSLSTALRAIKEDTGAGVTILKMDKTGHWVFGADQTEIEDDSLWAINPFSFVHGYIAWGDGEVLGEKMCSISEALPELDPAPAGAKRGWEKQVGFSLKCLNGEDEGLDARYTVTSVGGKRAAQELAVAIAEQVDKDQTKPVAVVSLGKEHYQHKSYGRIYTPIFKVVRWASMDGEAASTGEDVRADPEVEAPDEDAPRRRRRSA